MKSKIQMSKLRHISPVPIFLQTVYILCRLMLPCSGWKMVKL